MGILIRNVHLLESPERSAQTYTSRGPYLGDRQGAPRLLGGRDDRRLLKDADARPYQLPHPRLYVADAELCGRRTVPDLALRADHADRGQPDARGGVLGESPLDRGDDPERHDDLRRHADVPAHGREGLCGHRDARPHHPRPRRLGPERRRGKAPPGAGLRRDGVRKGVRGELHLRARPPRDLHLRGGLFSDT